MIFNLPFLGAWWTPWLTMHLRHRRLSFRTSCWFLLAIIASSLVFHVDSEWSVRLLLSFNGDDLLTVPYCTKSVPNVSLICTHAFRNTFWCDCAPLHAELRTASRFLFCWYLHHLASLHLNSHSKFVLLDSSAAFNYLSHICFALLLSCFVVLLMQFVFSTPDFWLSKMINVMIVFFLHRTNNHSTDVGIFTTLITSHAATRLLGNWKFRGWSLQQFCLIATPAYFDEARGRGRTVPCSVLWSNLTLCMGSRLVCRRLHEAVYLAPFQTVRACVKFE